jgi:hypothetical protein
MDETIGDGKRKDVRDSADQLFGRALTELVADVKKTRQENPIAVANFVQSGYFLDGSETNAFWGIHRTDVLVRTMLRGPSYEPEDAQTFAGVYDRNGTAYRAGLRQGDIVLAIDGMSTVDSHREMIDQLMLKRKEHVGFWKLTVRSQDGSIKSIRFENEPASCSRRTQRRS